MKRAHRIAVGVAGALAFAGSTWTTPAVAQPNAPDVARAVALFDDAKRELAAGNVDAACALFVDSYRVDPQVGTLLNTALCHERAGKTASAWAEFTSVVSLAGRAGQVKRSEFAGTHARALEPKLARVQLEIRETASDLAITVDGTAIAAQAGRTTAIPLDPGSHVLRATAPARTPWETTFVVAAGPSTGHVTVPSLAPAKVVVAPVPPPAAPSSNAGSVVSGADPDAGNEAPRSPLRWAAYGTAGAAVVGLVVGGVMGGLALSAQGTADRGCDGAVCRTTDALDANERAHTFATVSTIGFVAAGAFAAASIVLFVVAPKATSGARGRLTPSGAITF